MTDGVIKFPLSESVAEEVGSDVFRMMADGAPVPLWMSDASGQSTYHNRAWLDFAGRQREKMGGQAWVESVHPDDLDRCLKTYRRAFQERQKFEMEYRLRRHDGEYRWVLDTGSPCYRADGSFCGFVGVNFDITDQKEAQALASQFGRILDSS